MNINELLNLLENKYIEREEYVVKITGLGDKFIDQDIVINTTDLKIRNQKGELVPITVKAIYFLNCTFKSIKLSTKAELKYFDCENVILDDLLIEGQKLIRLSMRGAFNNFKLKNSNIEHTHIESINHINLIEFRDSDIKDIDIRAEDIKDLTFRSLKNCDKLSINTGGNLFSQRKIAIFEKITFFYCENINHISISTLLLPLHINTLYLDKFFNVGEFELKNLSLDYANINSRKVYDKLNVNFSDVKIVKKLEMKNIDFEKSVFKNLNLSKCLFNNSLISESLFYECKVDSIPDIPLMKFKKIAYVLILFIPILIAVISTEYTGLWKDKLIYVLTSMIPYIITFLVISFLLFFYKHVATLDEAREKHRKRPTSNLKIFLAFIGSTGKSLKNFFWKMDEKELHKIQEIESLNRQLKVAFETSKDNQNANEFIYSEMLMKIRQKNIWMNLLNVDFWNYLINGFGRRWRRALMNFVAVFIIAVVAFMNSVPFQFVITEKAPEFILEANQTVFEVMPKELDIGLISSIKINSDVNTTKGSHKSEDVTPIIANLLSLSSIYTLSKIDVFKVKANGWFEETSFWNFLKANVVSLVLLFFIGAFALAFKRRLDK